MIKMASDLQRETLENLAASRPGDLQYAEDLKRIYQDVEKEESLEDLNLREAAEERVFEVLQAHGERIGHGDLLTFANFRQAVLWSAGCQRAVDRLDFLGIFRMQLFHLVMSKTALDLRAAMPSINEVEDRATLASVAAATGCNSWLSNKKPKIVRVGNFERHHQHLLAWQTTLLLNMFDNFVKMKRVNMVGKVWRRVEVEEFLLEMLQSYGAICYWDPEYLDPMAERTCDVLLMARDQTIRLIISLCFKQCERENDALGLRTLRRIMISYFRNKSKEATSAYARNLVMDLVVEESSSERSRARMDNHVCVNPSGTRGGHLFRDKVNEHYVQEVKVQLGRQHSDHHDVQVRISTACNASLFITMYFVNA